MHFGTILLLCGMIGAVTAQCDHDNCLRAVIASAFPTRNGAADCSSYFMVTVTPATSTITKTSISTGIITTTTTATTATTTTTTTPGKKRRNNKFVKAYPVLEARQATVSPTSIPSYASACSGSVRYSSACSCIGVTQRTTTAATPLATTTTATTQSSTTTTTTTTTTTSTDVISPGPAVLSVNVFPDQGCDGTSSVTSWVAGTCYPSVDDITFESFLGGSCGTLATCQLNAFYSSSECPNSPPSFSIALESLESATTCTDFNAYEAVMLSCTC